jgi:rubrerythrin
MPDLRFGSTAEILAFAVAREIDAAAGYARIEALAGTPALRRLAGELREQEEGHRRLLEGLDPATLAGPAGRLTVDLRIVDGLPDERPAPDMSVQDMLVFAAKKEAQAVALYESLAPLAGTSEHQRLFRFLAAQEREHKLRLEAEYEAQILTEN